MIRIGESDHPSGFNTRISFWWEGLAGRPGRARAPSNIHARTLEERWWQRTIRYPPSIGKNVACVRGQKFGPLCFGRWGMAMWNSLSHSKEENYQLLNLLSFVLVFCLVENVCTFKLVIALVLRSWSVPRLNLHWIGWKKVDPSRFREEIVWILLFFTGIFIGIFIFCDVVL